MIDTSEVQLSISTSSVLNHFSEAFVKAQSEFTDPVKNTKGFNYKYAELDQILGIVRPILTTHGISIIQMVVGGDDLHIRIATRLLHTSGEWLQSILAMPIEQRKGMAVAQCLGSSVTYGRRYALQSICGIAAEEDTDAAPDRKSGNGADKIKKDDVTELQALIDASGADADAFLLHFHVKELKELPATQVARARSALNKKMERANADS